MLALLIASAAVLGAAVIAAALLTPRGAVAFVLAAGLLAEAIVVTTVGFAGLVVHSLSGTVLLALASAWLAAAVLAAWWRRGSVHWRRRAARIGTPVMEVLRYPPVAIAVALVVGTLAWRAFLAVRLPVVDYDGWSYHMVFVDVWLQHDALVPVLLRPWTSGYPADGELLATWLAAFTRTDALVGLSSLLPIPLAIAATIGLARNFGADRRMALLAGLLLGMTPALIALSGTSYVDAGSLTAVLATWWLGLRVVGGERDRSAALLLGIAGGLALGTKGTNLLLVTPVLAAAGIAFLVDLVRSRQGRGWLPPLGSLVAFGVPLLVLGVSWYAKNLVVHGNPIYPYAAGPFPGVYTLGSLSWAPPQLEHQGELEQVVRSWLADWHLGHYVYNQRPGGIGRAWFAIVPLAIAGLVLLASRRKVAALALVVIPAVITFVVAPNPWYARYTLFAPALALACAALVLSRMPRRFATPISLVLVALAAISLVFVNIRPNIDLKPAFAHVPTPRQYLAFVLDPDADRRANVSLRASCAGFDVIPPGARVVPGGFNLLHGVAGPSFERILTDPIGATSGPDALAAAMREQDATWLVTGAGGTNDAVAESDPGRFRPFGEICGGARLWQLQAGG